MKRSLTQTEGHRSAGHTEDETADPTAKGKAVEKNNSRAPGCPLLRASCLLRAFPLRSATVVGLGYTIAKTVAQADAVVMGPPILRVGNRGLNGERGMTPATEELDAAAARTRSCHRSRSNNCIAGSATATATS